MANHETLEPLDSFEQALYQEAQVFVDSFRNQSEVSSPNDWLNYIDIMAVSRDSIRISDFTIQELVPQPDDKSLSMLRFVRRYGPENKLGKYCALLILHRNHKDIFRLAVVHDEFEAGLYKIKKAVVHNGNVRTTDSNGLLSLITEFDSILKGYRTPGEIAHPSVYQ